MCDFTADTQHFTTQDRAVAIASRISAHSYAPLGQMVALQVPTVLASHIRDLSVLLLVVNIISLYAAS